MWRSIQALAEMGLIAQAVKAGDTAAPLQASMQAQCWLGLGA